MNTPSCGIYKIISPSGRVYIGQSVNIERRIKRHFAGYNKELTRLNMSFVKYGHSTHSSEIIELCSSSILNERERYWQDFYDVLNDNGLNCVLTNTNDRSGKVSRFTLDKMSKLMKGKPGRKGVDHPMYGKKHKEESKIKISESLKKVVFTDERRDKLKGKNNPFYGKTFSEEAKDKLRQKALNRYSDGEHPKNRNVIDLSTNKVFTSARDAAIFHNIKYKTLISWLSGHRINKSNLRYE